MAIYSSAMSPGGQPHRPVASTFSRGHSGAVSRQLRSTLLASIIFGCGLRGHSQRKAHILLAVRTELLVDGDCHSIDGIRLAIKCLQEHCGQRVYVTLFASPRRCDNKKWARFMQENGISFRSVHRGSSGISAEPNDEAISREMRELSKLNVSIALLTEDTDFIDTILDLQPNSANITVLVPENRTGMIRQYETQGVSVLPVTLPKRHGSKVRAILHENGSGSVTFADPYEPPSYGDFEQAYKNVARLLQDLGYEGNLVQSCAKFWMLNQLGSLTVFPRQIPVLAAQTLFANFEFGIAREWEPYSRELAYFLPAYSKTRLTKIQERTYGYRLARSVFQAGGPFVLENSSELVLNALRKLGYLDGEFNTDVSEAMLVFINLPSNKTTLRKYGWLPVPGDNQQDVDQKLRLAFLSHQTPGEWQAMNNSSTARGSVLQILKKSQILSSTEDSIEDTFEGMKSYAKQQQLPVMRTFNGLVWTILRHKDKSPTSRRMVDFDR